MASLDGKVAIVSGASSGIGKSVAERLASDGASVVITYAKSADKAQQVVNTIAEKGKKALALPADFTQVGDIRNLFQETLRHFGKLDILVISGSVPRVEKPMAEVTEEEFDYTIQPQPNMAVTAGSKAAADQFTFALAKELGSRGIRVNAIMPGPTTTESFANQVSAELQTELERISPLQRLAKPGDIANAVAFLVSDEAAYVTGHTLHVTGGLA